MINPTKTSTISAYLSNSTTATVYFLKDSVHHWERVLNKVSVHVENSFDINTLYMLIWSPACPIAQSYCYRMNACVNDASQCKNVSNSIRRVSCPSESHFSVGLRGCYRNDGTRVNQEFQTNPLLEFSRYYLSKAVPIHLLNKLLGQQIYDYLIPYEVLLAPGDVAAIILPNTSYAFPTYKYKVDGGEPRLSVIAINNLELIRFGMELIRFGSNGSENITFQATDLIDSGMLHQIQLFYSKPIYYSHLQTFVADCWSNETYCKKDIAYKTRAKLRSYNDTLVLQQDVFIQHEIKNFDFDFQPHGILQ